MSITVRISNRCTQFSNHLYGPTIKLPYYVDLYFLLLFPHIPIDSLYLPNKYLNLKKNESKPKIKILITCTLYSSGQGKIKHNYCMIFIKNTSQGAHTLTHLYFFLSFIISHEYMCVVEGHEISFLFHFNTL